jgi:hypothetical protein
MSKIIGLNIKFYKPSAEMKLKPLCPRKNLGIWSDLKGNLQFWAVFGEMFRES